MTLRRPLVQPLARALRGPMRGLPSNGLSIQPVAYWNLDEESGTRADSIGSLDLTDNNGVGSGDGVGAGQTAAAFVAANSEYLSHVDDDVFRIGDRDWTMAMWVRPETLATVQRVLGKGSLTVGADNEYDLFLNTNGSAAFRANNVAGNTLVSATTAAGAAVVDTWMLLFAGYDATTEEIFVRPNLGTEVRTARADGTHVNTYPLLLGARGGLYSTFRLAAGGIFPGLLTDNDRSYLYNGGTAARLAVGGVV